MSSSFFGKTDRVAEVSGMRPATYFVKSSNGVTAEIEADYLTMDNERITFFKDMPGERDFILASYLSKNILRLEEMKGKDEK